MRLDSDAFHYNPIRLDLDAFQYLSKGKFWKDLWKEMDGDDCWGTAAQLSYYFLLAFFPFLIFLSALIGLIPLEPGLLEKMLLEMHQFLPERTYTWVRNIAVNLVNSGNTGVLSLGILLALWWASIAFNGIGGVLNRAYAIRDPRSYFKVRLVAVGVTILVSIFVINSGILLFFGDWLIKLLLSRITIEPYPSFRAHLGTIYSASRWILIFLLLNIGIQIVYSALLARRLPWTLLSPGSMIATLGWIVGSRGFAFCVNRFVSYEIYQRLYGSLGTLIVLMIWFYLSSFFLLLGGEINSEIYHVREKNGTDFKKDLTPQSV
ncbi:YihY/virulence factor BrkB family protein [Acidobacteria bacterium AH-259-L09]|nr:YihY/virulence factor BrkB family protein [Acidobacteria bacterium AH-259-L09]